MEGREGGGRPCRVDQVGCLPLIHISKKRYLGTSIHSDGAPNFKVTTGRGQIHEKDKQLRSTWAPLFML